MEYPDTLTLDPTSAPSPSPLQAEEPNHHHHHHQQPSQQSTKQTLGTVAFLALGSLGDCLPLCVLAATLPAHFRRSQHTHGLQLGRGLAERRHASSRGDLRSDGETGGLQRQKRRADPDGNRTSADRIGSRCTVTATVVTHRSNCGLLKELMERTFEVAEPPKLCPVDLPVLFSYGAEKAEPSSGTAGGEGTQGQTRRKEFGSPSESSVYEELEACMAVLEGLKPKALVFNLYSAFGYHLAEALGIPCVCASPGVPPSYGVVPLRRVISKPVLARLDEERGEDGDKITIADVELWMSPLFLPYYRNWRLQRGLQATMVSSDEDMPIPPACPIVFGVSPAVCPRPGYWPLKADVCGFWSFRRLSPAYQPPRRLVRFLEAAERAKKPVLCVGLGSMPGLGLVQDHSGLLSMVTSCLLEAGLAVVLLPTPNASSDDVSASGESARMCETPSTGDSSSQILMKGARQSDERNRTPRREKAIASTDKLTKADVLGLDLAVGDGEGSGSGFVPHLWLLPRCRGLVHHGGSGTTGAALEAGVAQVVIPVAFDQFFFADQMEHMGVGSRVPGTTPPPSTREDEPFLKAGNGVTQEGLRVAISRALSASTMTSAHRYRAAIALDDGVEKACTVVVSKLTRPVS